MAAPTLSARLYSLLFRRTSTFALTIAVGALFFERAFDQGADAVYEHINHGVRAWAIPDLGAACGVTMGQPGPGGRLWGDNGSGRTSTFALTIAVGALFFERAFDQGADAVYEHINHGKLWKHIKHKYEDKE
ncbi:Cytochrome b-c1 complex subunit 9 [Tupaia chinensis]|uniref:Cytochrome b-c1 complex subunit 9 n=1 Tax=Tupaia chinensis TaxID=246437 RepID=L9KUE7_TUPCH|nr:Cytochrome b-c1 complex subunit 9 [Tupaia chinensis]